MANPFVHVELNTQDVAKAKSFYRSMFAWALKDVDMGGGMIYTMINVGDGTGNSELIYWRKKVHRQRFASCSVLQDHCMGLLPSAHTQPGDIRRWQQSIQPSATAVVRHHARPTLPREVPPGSLSRLSPSNGRPVRTHSI